MLRSVVPFHKLFFSVSYCDAGGMPSEVSHLYGGSHNSKKHHKLSKQPQNDTNSKWDTNWDLLGDTKPSGVRQIILVRHGQYDNSGRSDELRGLTDLGKRQLELTGQRLKELTKQGKIFPLQSVYYSTMRRATESFHSIKPSLPELPSHRMRPCSMIAEGAVCRPDPPSPGWRVSDEAFEKEGKRAEAAFAYHLRRAKDSEPGEQENHSTLYVCHGNVIRYFVMRALQLPPEAWLRTAVYNGSITVLNIYPSGKVSLVCMGDVGFLPADMITYH